MSFLSMGWFEAGGRLPSQPAGIAAQLGDVGVLDQQGVHLQPVH
jgi:hypothetical protein